MILRVVAWYVELWGAIGRLRRAWRALPGDLLGRAVLVAFAPGASARRGPVGGLRDREGPPLEALVVEDARLAHYLDAVPLRPTAQTLGRYVLARRPLPPGTVRHELEHVRQWARWGPFFLPLYLAESARALATGGDTYRDNRFEIAARAAEERPG